MDSSSYQFPKLKGSSNWEIWSLRASAVLAQKGYIEIMMDPTMSEPPEPHYRDYSALDEDQKKAQNLTQEAYQQELIKYRNYSTNRQIQSLQAASLIRLLLEDGPLL
jgi:hypothetical protein